MTLKALTDVTPAERTYLDMVRKRGIAGPIRKRLDIQDPVVDDGESDCWTHAWQVAQRIGGTYVEGVCVRPGASGPSFHAWVEEVNPLTGPTLVETTAGYEQAAHYLGIAVDCTPGGLIEEVTKSWGSVRASVIQALLAGGQTPERVLMAVGRG